MPYLRLAFGDDEAAIAATAAAGDQLVATREYRLNQLKGDRFPRGYALLSVHELAAAPAPGEPADGVVSLVGTPYPGQADPVAADHLYLTFSSAPASVSEEDYVDWYRRHLAENLDVAGFDAGWRLATTPADPGAHTEPVVTHLAMYALDGEMPELFDRLHEATARGRLTYPVWMADRGRVSMEAVATGPRRPR